MLFLFAALKLKGFVERKYNVIILARGGLVNREDHGQGLVKGALKGLCPLYARLKASYKNCAKNMVHRVLSDRYRITQDKFQYYGIEI